jgi:hemin uptake protein HemP
MIDTESATRIAAIAQPPAATPSVIESRALLGQSRELLIQHGTETYRLKLTRHDKLILTK